MLPSRFFPVGVSSPGAGWQYDPAMTLAVDFFHARCICFKGYVGYCLWMIDQESKKMYVDWKLEFRFLRRSSRVFIKMPWWHCLDSPTSKNTKVDPQPSQARNSTSSQLLSRRSSQRITLLPSFTSTRSLQFLDKWHSLIRRHPISPDCTKSQLSMF